MWSSIKRMGSKVMTRNIFHGNPISKLSLWRWRAQADRSHVDKQAQAAKTNEYKLLTTLVVGSGKMYLESEIIIVRCI